MLQTVIFYKKAKKCKSDETSYRLKLGEKFYVYSFLIFISILFAVKT